MHGEPRSAREARVSVVIPVYNDEAVLPELRQRLCAALGGIGSGFEVLLVDDGSAATPARA